MLKKCQKPLGLPMKNVSVCTFKTSPCVPAPRAHMLKHVCVWCRCTRQRFERTHGDVLSGHITHHTTPHTHHNTTQHNTTQHNTTQHNTTQHNTTQHNTTQHNNTTTTPHGDRDRDRQRQGKKTGTEREEKTEEERQDKTREGRGFIFSVVVDGFFLC